MEEKRSMVKKISGCCSDIRRYHREREFFKIVGVLILVLTLVFLMGLSSLMFQGGSSKNRMWQQTQRLHILSTGELHIQEVVEVRYAEGNSYTGLVRQLPEKHFIERVTYRKKDLPNQEHKPHPYTTIGGNRIDIRGEKALPAGAHEYELSYFASDMIVRKPGGSAEIFWNITGDNRRLPIEHIYFSVFPPESVAPGEISTTLFIQDRSGNRTALREGPGAYDLSVTSERKLFSTNRTLRPEETLIAHVRLAATAKK